MKTNAVVSSLIGLLALCSIPAIALASGSASIGALLPGDTVGVGTPVTFSVITSGFIDPTYWVVDSFGGGVNNQNIDASGNLSWTPNNSAIGAHTITVTVSDAQGDTASASQTITVTAPSITIGQVSPSASIPYGTPITFALSSVGFLSPQYSVADSFDYSSIAFGNTSAAGVFQWTPVFQDIGAHTLVATARDYVGHLATSSIQIIVTGPMSVRIMSIMPGTTAHVGDSVSLTATTTGFTQPSFAISDAFTSTLGTSSLAIDQTGTVTWTPAPNDIGTHRITISASDASGNNGSALATIQIVPGRSAPSSAAPAVTASTSISTSTGAAVAAQTPATPTAHVFTKYLSVGSTGADVLALQQLLAQLGFFTATPTGYFGSVTTRAVKAYQSAHSISTLGVVGPMTRASLDTGR
jgi:hypothetical protein